MSGHSPAPCGPASCLLILYQPPSGSTCQARGDTEEHLKAPKRQSHKARLTLGRQPRAQPTSRVSGLTDPSLEHSPTTHGEPAPASPAHLRELPGEDGAAPPSEPVQLRLCSAAASPAPRTVRRPYRHRSSFKPR